MRTFDQTYCAFGQMRNLPNAPYIATDRNKLQRTTADHNLNTNP